MEEEYKQVVTMSDKTEDSYTKIVRTTEGHISEYVDVFIEFLRAVGFAEAHIKKIEKATDDLFED